MTTFISYSRANSNFVVRLAKDLKAAGHDVWLDQLDIPKGARWDDELENALRTCTTFLIILSPESIESQNVKDEIGYAIDAGKHILPIMIKQCEIPFRLRRFQYVDFTNEAHDEYEERFKETKALLSNTAELPKATEDEKSSQPAQVPVSKQAEKKLLTNPYLLGGGGVIVLILIAVFVFGNLGAPTPAPTPEPTSTDEPAKPTDTAEPQFVVVTSTPPSTATTPAEEPTPEPQPFFTETFDEDLSNWSTIVTSGDKNRLKIYTENGRMVFDLGDPNSDLYAYSIFDEFTYDDVQMEVVALNRGVNVNNVSLVCRYKEGRWFEFNIGNDGFYTIFAYDSLIGYDPLFEGGSTAIKSGQSTNKYTAICKGNTLSLFINDQEVRTITVNRYNYASGNIGLSVSSFQVLPVKVEFDSLVISEPK
jgi:hypothetical protein